MSLLIKPICQITFYFLLKVLYDSNIYKEEVENITVHSDEVKIEESKIILSLR